MHVRMTQIDGVKDVDGATAVLKDVILPGVKGLKGFRGITAAADRKSGEMSILTLWDSEADEKASAGQVAQIRENSIKSIGGNLVAVQAFEQVVNEVITRPEPGCPLLITPTKMDPAKVDENLEFFKTTVLPDIKSTPGCRAVRYLLNRQAGEGMVGVVLDDDKAVKDAEARAEQRRPRAAQQGVELGERSRREVIFAAMQ